MSYINLEDLKGLKETKIRGNKLGWLFIIEDGNVYYQAFKGKMEGVIVFGVEGRTDCGEKLFIDTTQPIGVNFGMYLQLKNGKVESKYY